MSLTRGIGALARPSQGQLNADLWSVAPAHALFLHPVAERLRGHRFKPSESTVTERGRVMRVIEYGL